MTERFGAQEVGEGEYFIRGRKAASKNEFYTAQALDYFEIDYLYQVFYWGGSNLAGGLILDFLVWAPFPRGLEIMGEYWHSAQMQSRDKLKQVQLEQFLKQPIDYLWGTDTETEEKAMQSVKKLYL